VSTWNPVPSNWEDPIEENKNELKALSSVDFANYQYTNGTRNPERFSPDAWIRLFASIFLNVRFRKGIEKNSPCNL
jgi:hypothetical protein